MDLLQDFESTNARDWDENSSIAHSSDLSAFTNLPTRSRAGRVSSITQQNPKHRSVNNRNRSLGNRQGDNGPARGLNNANHPSSLGQLHQTRDLNNGKSSYLSPSRGNQQPQHGTRQDHRHTGSGIHNTRASPDVKPGRWAKVPRLVTTRMNNVTIEKEREKAQSEKYFRSVEAETEYPATAYYLWPKKDINPRELLGWKLDKLDVLRRALKVIIDWDDKKHCLTISSERANSDHTLIAAIKGIRQAVQSSEAEVTYASPLYIVTPPTARVMTSKVQPKYDRDKNIVGVELGGRHFSTLEQDIWTSNREALISRSLTRFKAHLIKHTALLAPLIGWMRMRVHFGHARLGKVREEFVQSKYSLQDFTKMMDLSRVRTSGKFDRKLDDATLAAKILQKMAESPHFFCPAQAKILSLKDIKPKHMGIIFIDIPDGENLRIEAEVDYTREDGLGQYQIGSTRLFRDNKRNKRVEVTTLDIESEFDWTLEIITDGSVNDLPDQLISLIDGSLAGNSKERKDCLGLLYPGVSPKFTYGLDVRTVVVRSVYQYLLRESGYIVEIAVYREWCGYNTAGAPKMLSSVSMFHPVWDDQMGSIENTTRSRNWDAELNCFFGEDEGGGIRKFMEGVVLIQGLLSEAAGASKEQQGVLCSFAGMDDFAGGA